MMLRRELEEAAVAKGLPLRNAEKDYLLDTCLLVLSRYGKTLVFKGGTALYKFHGLNRFSEDLDHVLDKRRFDPEELRDRIMRAAQSLGIGSVPGRFERYPREVNMDFQFRGPLYDGRRESLVRVALNLSLRERPASAEALFYSSPYREIPAFEIHVMSAPEMLAEKVRAVMTRNKPRDVYDIWFLTRKGIVPGRAMVDKKLRIYGLKYTPAGFLSAIEEKRGIWAKDLRGLLLGRLPEFGTVFQDLKKEAGRWG